MAQYEATIANTRLDRQGERLAKESLLLLAESINKHYIPVGIEHDPRQAPIGRVLSAFVRDCEDGEHEVIATFEIFDESPAEDCSKANREVVPIDFDSPGDRKSTRLNSSHPSISYAVFCLKKKKKKKKNNIDKTKKKQKTYQQNQNKIRN